MADQFSGAGNQYPAGSFYAELQNRIAALEAVLGTAPGAIPDNSISSYKLDPALRLAIFGKIDDFRNKIINGDFDVWQRGISFASLNTYTADRWRSSSSAAGSVSLLSFPNGQTLVPGNPRNYCHYVKTGTTDYGAFSQRIESVRTLSGKKATVTAYLKADAAVSVRVRLDQNFGTGGAPSAAVTTILGSAAVATGWQKFQFVVDIPSISGKTVGTSTDDFLALSFFPANLDTSWVGYLDISHVSIVEGDASQEDDPFSARQLQQEVSLCQRYFEAGTVYAYTYMQNVTAAGTDQQWAYVHFKQNKRAFPTIGLTNGGTGTLSPQNTQTTGFTVNRTGLFSAALSATFTADAEL